MEIRFFHDADTGLPHIFGHGVSEAEVEQVLRGPGEDIPGTQNSRLKLGQTSAGRYLQVVYVPDDDNPQSVFVVTAYDLQGKAKLAFRRRRRRRAP
jgi:hypothetical protein